MKICGNWPVGVCSWSLQSGLDAVARFMKDVGLEHIHLDCESGIVGDGQAFVESVREKEWKITSSMVKFPQEDYSTLDAIKRTGGIVPDECWESSRDRVVRAIELTAELGVPFLSTHAGFIDQSKPEYARKFHERVRILANVAAQKGITLLMETGQESADELKMFLEELDHPALGINFDPANMILYNKDDPIDAVLTLAPWIKHVHIKDAVRTVTPGEWGAEVPWGEGEVGASGFLDVLREIGFDGALVVERESGDARAEDIKNAVVKLTGGQQGEKE